MTEVSVVIPTRGRPHLVGRAVASALAQSAPDPDQYETTRAMVR